MLTPTFTTPNKILLFCGKYQLLIAVTTATMYRITRNVLIGLTQNWNTFRVRPRKAHSDWCTQHILIRVRNTIVMNAPPHVCDLFLQDGWDVQRERKKGEREGGEGWDNCYRYHNLRRWIIIFSSSLLTFPSRQNKKKEAVNSDRRRNDIHYLWVMVFTVQQQYNLYNLYGASDEIVV